MTSYRKTVTEDQPQGLPYSPTCSVDGCRNKTVVNIRGALGTSTATRCAKHYMQDVDRAHKAADSNRLAKYLPIEREELREVGIETYRKEVFNRMRELAKRMQMK